MVIHLLSFNSTVVTVHLNLCLAKKTAYISLPFLGDSFFTQVKQRIHSATALAFFAIEPRIVAITRRIPVRSLKDPLLEATFI